MEPINKTLKKITAATSMGSSVISSNTELDVRSSTMAGDPNCPICHGIGYIHQDLPVGHPDFGKVKICSCRQPSIAQTAQQRLYRLSNLDAFAQMNFDNFKTEGRPGQGLDQINSLKTALNVSINYSQNLKGWLLLKGGYGCGKTHLAAAIANFVVSVGVPTLFLTVPDLLDWLRFSYDETGTSFEERFDEIRNIQLLILDDLGTQNATAWAEEKLFQIINHRYTNKLATVITTNQKMEEIDGRISSRLMDPELVTPVIINSPDYRSSLRDSSQSQVSSLEYYSKKTFKTFERRLSEKLSPEEQINLDRAVQDAQQFADKPNGWLVFMGGFGTGKTHLAAAIGNYRHSEGDAPMFVVVPDLLDHLRATFSPNSSVSYDSLFEEVKKTKLLILDDLGTQSATPWAREKLYQIFNHRYISESPTVITTSQRLEDLDPRLKSRMSDSRICKLYALQVPPYRGSGMEVKPRRVRKTTGNSI
ncbi:MAG TPA: ATP-binding protein [Anaerolineaceae bacterium]|nr:ATP-binding protein [Anaerolineaceae bacterium]